MGKKADEFEMKINDLSKKGWVAAGGITTTMDQKGSVNWAVLMGKEESKMTPTPQKVKKADK